MLSEYMFVFLLGSLFFNNFGVWYVNVLVSKFFGFGVGFGGSNVLFLVVNLIF